MSISRVMPALLSDEELAYVRRFKQLYSRFQRSRDLISVGAYVRGSDPDAALYWFARMLDGGADPNYLARRLTRMASEMNTRNSNSRKTKLSCGINSMPTSCMA